MRSIGLFAAAAALILMLVGCSGDKKPEEKKDSPKPPATKDAGKPKTTDKPDAGSGSK